MRQSHRSGASGITRRAFLGRTAAATLAAAGGRVPALLVPMGGGLFSSLARVGNDDSSCEALARTIEEAPRERLFDLVAARLRAGLDERQLAAALLLAAVGNINPRPCGFNLHSVFVLHSASRLGALLPHEERLLPWFWALDYFKRAQAADVARGDWRLSDWSGTAIAPDQAAAELQRGFREWDDERTEAALVALWRAHPGIELFEQLWEAGARDLRNLGHKAIYTANLRRTLEHVGLVPGEAALRSLASSLCYLGTKGAANGFHLDDQCYGANVERLARQPAPATSAIDGVAAEPAAVRDLVRSMLSGDSAAACDRAWSGVRDFHFAVQDVWDAVHLAAADLMLRKPGIDALHAVTSANALHFAGRTAVSPRLRALLLLQAVGWMAHFATITQAPGSRDGQILELTAVTSTIPADPAADTVAEILECVGRDRDRAARLAFGYASHAGDLGGFLQRAASVLVAKSDDVHAYKFAAALFEELQQVGERWRPYLLAASTAWLATTRSPDLEITARARTALHGV